jgi:hypothetical protein
MAKLRHDPITAKDLEEFVGSDSDFAFEMQVLSQLRGAGFECAHSGTYRDPVTDKIRQFDIRAVKHEGNLTLALAVECKNLRPNYPLLLSAVPRTTPESFHDLIVWERQSFPYPQSVRPVTGAASAYKPAEMVAKKTDQVGRDTSDGLVSDDQATFEKLNQAVNSCRDLVQDYLHESSPPLVRAIVPLLVVPPGLLWQVDYSADGNRVTGPRQVKHTSLFLKSAWSVDLGVGAMRSYRLSHIELVTLDALSATVATYLGAGGFFAAVKG